MAEQILRTKKFYQFHQALPACLDGSERAGRNLRPIVVLVNTVEAARKALAAAKAHKSRGRPGSIECVRFLFGGPPPFEAPEAWPQDRLFAWSQANIAWIRKHAGPNAVLAAAYHYTDERRRYLHVLLIPITDKGGLSWTALERRFALHPKVPSKDILGSMQDRYQREVGKRFGLKRGETGARRKHEAINAEKGLFERALELPTTWSDRQRAEEAVLRAEAADRERDRAVRRQREAEADRDRAVSLAASAEAERAVAVEERTQAVVKGTEAETECDDLERLLNELARERDEVRKDCDQIRDARKREAAEHAAECAHSELQLRNTDFLLPRIRTLRDQALREIENLRKAAPPTQAHLERALEHARAADEARVAAEAERDQATAGRDRARQGYLAEKRRCEHLDAKLVQDVAEARRQGYTQGQASRAGEVDEAAGQAGTLQVELAVLRTRRSAAVQVARREGLAAGRAELDDQVRTLEKTVERLTSERDDRVRTLKHTIERLTTQLNTVNQHRERLDDKAKNLADHGDDLEQRLTEPPQA